MKLDGRRILLTGATSGIGLETALLFAREGAQLALVSRDMNRANTAAARLEQPASHVCVLGDVSRPDDIASLVDDASRQLGGLDGVVHCAGLNHVAGFTDTSLATWQAVINVNLTSAFVLCQSTLTHLRAAGGGTIVTLASGAALLPLPGRTACCAAKAGLVMFSKALALEVAKDNIRVNALCPGAIDTPMLRESAGGEVGDPMPREIVSRFAMGRVGEADDIARAALFLSCDDSSFVTGAALAADGGRSFHEDTHPGEKRSKPLDSRRSRPALTLCLRCASPLDIRID